MADRSHSADGLSGGLTYLLRCGTPELEAGTSVTETYRIRIRSGATQESAAHSPDTTEHIIVLTGTALVGEAANPVLIGPGMHGTWAADTPHLYRAPAGDVEAVLLVRHPK
ncbi:hypothetical protein [Streptomyces sp. NBC_00659]|uniref:hypothetical protein n=1 Tax=Streptomyces sp. NBC_00659 TaxID=2903669 RepID=UPI002E2F60F7|nr:hypothetical protein [Streptomyces sp. NBC_00659]